jgi:hypothetical protein
MIVQLRKGSIISWNPRNTQFIYKVNHKDGAINWKYNSNTINVLGNAEESKSTFNAYIFTQRFQLFNDRFNCLSTTVQTDNSHNALYHTQNHLLEVTKSNSLWQKKKKKKKSPNQTHLAHGNLPSYHNNVHMGLKYINDSTEPSFRKHHMVFFIKNAQYSAR